MNYLLFFIFFIVTLHLLFVGFIKFLGRKPTFAEGITYPIIIIFIVSIIFGKIFAPTPESIANDMHKLTILMERKEAREDYLKSVEDACAKNYKSQECQKIIYGFPKQNN